MLHRDAAAALVNSGARFSAFPGSRCYSFKAIKGGKPVYKQLFFKAASVLNNGLLNALHDTGYTCILLEPAAPLPF